MIVPLNQPQIIVWNPSTRKSVTLPMAPKTQCPTIAAYGFGAHPTTQEYKAFLNGVVHWVAVGNPREEGGFRQLIMLFNMASESFSEFMLPTTLADEPLTSLLSIKLFGESLALFCNRRRDGDACCIWVMKEYGVAESWTNLFSSNLLGMPNKALGFRKVQQLQRLLGKAKPDVRKQCTGHFFR
ncbi:hypothetical protein RHGRI_010077 [Rhododendron griersonianum]|uniref:F-box associated beta-propeller type 1 domain-containing protein n=1 Tax=Rhododendron griersonianum TaxID=479676 RepID=A0AAV6KHX1_9ERIC|nr:hypothetical protein RHGRI_010077 [Rhododendron griersonianum]